MNKKVIATIALLLAAVVLLMLCRAIDKRHAMSDGITIGESDEEGLGDDFILETTGDDLDATTAELTEDQTEATESGIKETEAASDEKGNSQETKPNNQGGTQETKPNNQGGTQETKPNSQGNTQETKPNSQDNTQETEPNSQGNTQETKPNSPGSTQETTPPETTPTEPAPELPSGYCCEYAAYTAMSPAKQQAYMEHFPSVMDFIAWCQRAQLEHEAHDKAEEGSGDIDIGDYMGNG